MSGSNAVESLKSVATTMLKNHTQIFLLFLNDYKQLTYYELLILKNLFDSRLKIFNKGNPYSVSAEEIPRGIHINEKKSVLPNPGEISTLNGNILKPHLLNGAKVNYEFIYKLCDLVISDVTLRTLKETLKISYKTAIFWRYKVFVAIEDYIKLLKLRKIVYFDKIFVKLINSDSDYKSEWKENNKNHSSPFYGKVTIAIGLDQEGTVICKMFSERPATREFYKFYYEKIVEEGSILISDMHSGASELITSLNLKDGRVKSNYNDSTITEILQPLNSLSNSAKAFLENKHRGITYSNMQDYLNLFSLKQSLIKHNYSHNEMVIFLVELLYSSPKTLKFKDIFPK